MITPHRAFSLAAAALADSKRVLDQQAEKFTPEFRTELHQARDYILHLAGNATEIVPRDTNPAREVPVVAATLSR